MKTVYLDNTDSTGKFTSTITGSDGSVTDFERSADGLSVFKSLSCGTDLQFEYDVDKAFKTKFVKEMTESMPSGLSRVTLRDKTYTDADEENNFEHISETVTVNNKTVTLDHDVLQSLKTVQY